MIAGHTREKEQSSLAKQPWCLAQEKRISAKEVFWAVLAFGSGDCKKSVLIDRVHWSRLSLPVWRIILDDAQAINPEIFDTEHGNGRYNILKQPWESLLRYALFPFFECTPSCELLSLHSVTLTMSQTNVRRWVRHFMSCQFPNSFLRDLYSALNPWHFWPVSESC